MWPELKFPPVNLYTVWPSKQMIKLRGEYMSALNKQVSGSYYKEQAIQPVEYIHANQLDFFEGNVVKYVTRWRLKNGLSDLEKAKHYIELLIELENNKL